MAFNLRGILSLNNSKFNTGLSESASQSDKFSKKVKKSESSVRGLVRTAGTLAGTIGFATMAKESVMLASDLVEVQNVVDVTFGDASKTIDKFASGSATAFGISELQAKQFNGTLGAMMKSSGIAGDKLVDMSTGLSGLAGDMASFYNLKPDVAFDKLRSAISGETEPMKALGVNMSVANMEAFALTQGIKKQWREMDQAQQTTLRYQYIMNATKDSQGDFNRTNGEFANQLKIAELNTKTLGAKIGATLLPKLNEGVTAFNELITSIDDTSTPIGLFVEQAKSAATDGVDVLKKSISWVIENKDLVISAFAGLTTALITYKAVSKAAAIVDGIRNGTTLAGTAYQTIRTGVLYGMIAAEVSGSTVTGVFTAAQWLLNAALTANPIGLVAVAIGVFVGGIVLAYKKVEWFRNIVNKTWEVLKGVVGAIAEFFGLADSGGEISVVGRLEREEAKARMKSEQLEGNANGTAYFRGGASMVNERGGEMQVLRNGTSVIPADRTKQMIEGQSGKGETTNHFHIDARGMSVDELVTKLKRRLANV